ncbi:MAG: hypothetical protein LBK60_09155, partial [Verrucomicrobiales bacterium]|nr:hypothetical protein [Verrucomicrobiales bacterium]
PSCASSSATLTPSSNNTPAHHKSPQNKIFSLHSCFTAGEFSSGNHTPLLLSFREEEELLTLMLTLGVMFVALFVVS